MLPEPPPEPKPANAVAKYAGVAFQMLAMIAVCVWAGMKLDQWQGLKTPWFTLGLALLGVVGAMYLVIRQASDDARNEGK